MKATCEEVNDILEEVYEDLSGEGKEDGKGEEPVDQGEVGALFEECAEGNFQAAKRLKKQSKTMLKKQVHTLVWMRKIEELPENVEDCFDGDEELVRK